MPVHVHVPVRVRVDAAALAGRGGALEAGVERAVGRAVARSRTALDEGGHGHLGPHLHALEVRWTGAGLHAVTEGTRRATERRLAAAIGEAARGAGVGTPPAVPPLSGRPAEPFDPSRAQAFGRYVLDSYEGGERVAVPVESPAEDRLRDAFVREWERATVTDLVDLPYVRQRLQGEALAQAVALGGVNGLLVRGVGGGDWTLILSADGFAGPRTALVRFRPQARRRPAGLLPRTKRVRYVEEEIVPPLTAAALVEVALPGDEAERIARLHDLLGASIRTELRDAFDPSEEMSANLLAPAELDALLAEEVEAEIARQNRALGGCRFLLRLDWGDQRFNVALPDSLATRLGWTGPEAAVVLPAVTEVEGPAPLIGTGGAGGAHARGDGGGGGGSAPSYGTDGGGTGPGGPAPVFPSLGGGSSAVCAPFEEAEPPLSALPGEAPRLRRLVAEIAQRLDMVPCEFPATFCVAAAETLARHARAVSAVAGAEGTGALTMPRAGGGNVGGASFRPTASRGIQLLRRLSQAAARVAALRRLVRTVYMNGEGKGTLGGRFAGNTTSWVLRFEEAVSPHMKEGVGEIFAQTCQLVMLQLLETSAQQIAARRRNIHAYAPLFRDVLVRRLADLGTLTTLRDRLRAFELAQTLSLAAEAHPVAAVAAEAALPGWATAARALSRACVATEGFAHAPGAAHDVVTEGGTARIRDAHGFLWTRDALERAIAERRGQAESIDPLIQQLSDIPETVEEFRRDPGAAEPLLSSLLERMARLNAEKRMEAGADPRFGLRVGRIDDETLGNQVPGLRYPLAGIHLVAHEQIYPFFDGAVDAYAEGVDHIFSVELGIEGLTHFFTFTGLALLAVICAPAAFAVGGLAAAHEVDKAEARRDLYRALIDPELVLSRTEVELELYIAYVGLALSLLPEAGAAARAVSTGVRGGLRTGSAAAGLRIAGRAAVRHVGRQVTAQLARDMAPALVREFAVNGLMEFAVVPAVAGPLIAAVEREMAVHSSVGGIAGAERLIARIEEAAAARARAPLPGGAAPSGGGG